MLQVVCRRCRHETLLYPIHLGRQIGWATPVAEIAPRLTCSNCRAKGMANVYEAMR